MPIAQQALPVKSAERVMIVIEQIGSAGALSHSSLAELLGIPKSSLTQLLRTLTARGWLTHSSEARTYTLGPAIEDLAKGKARAQSLSRHAAAVLARLTASTGETSAFNVRAGMMTEVIATELSSARLRSIMQRGDTAPLHAVSGGKAMLAFLSDAEIEAFLEKARFDAITEKSLTTPAALWRQIEEIRARGFATSIEEFTAGVAGVAMPVLDDSGRPLASINVVMPLARYSEAVRRRVVAHLKIAVGELDSAQLTPRVRRELEGFKS